MLRGRWRILERISRRVFLLPTSVHNEANRASVPCFSLDQMGSVSVLHTQPGWLWAISVHHVLKLVIASVGVIQLVLPLTCM